MLNTSRSQALPRYLPEPHIRAYDTLAAAHQPWFCCVWYGRFAVYGRFTPTGPTRRRCGAADRRWHAADRDGSLASPAEAAPATRSDMTEVMHAMMPPHATKGAA